MRIRSAAPCMSSYWPVRIDQKKGQQPQRAEYQCQRNEPQKRGHRRISRMALTVTTTDDADIATAATSGVTKPSTAMGTAMTL